MRRRRRNAFHEPSLVPLADMLSNTVGIIVFILIFTVLTAGGAVVLKRLPMEREASGKMVAQVCYHNRLLPLDQEGLVEKFVKPFERDRPTLDNLDSWLSRFNNRKLDDPYFSITGEAGLGLGLSLDWAVYFKPKNGVGQTVEDLKLDTASFRQELRSRKSGSSYVYFFVYPDSNEVFLAAREIARNMNYKTGWDPRGQDDKLGFGNGGRSGTTD